METGEEDYDVHEEIVIDNVKVVTSLADEDFEELALTTVKGGLSYKLVLDDYLNISKLNDEYADAESLYLTILGSEYELVGATKRKIDNSNYFFGNGDGCWSSVYFV